MFTETQLVTINDQLRFVLFGLECALDAEFSVDAVEKIFSDGEQDAVSEKRYKLWAVKRQSVTGYVEAYEPADVWLTVQSLKPFAPSLRAIIERAKYQAYRLSPDEAYL
jgi:hypothetical protein